ncbi:hypothetical protein Tco_1501224, partial [Tanacetum coccineum]
VLEYEDWTGAVADINEDGFGEGIEVRWSEEDRGFNSLLEGNSSRFDNLCKAWGFGEKQSKRCLGYLGKNGIAIHMLTEKKYPLSQEMISKMLKKKLEVDHESSQAFELLSTNGVSTASTNLVLPELVNTARRKINTADGRSC